MEETPGSSTLNRRMAGRMGEHLMVDCERWKFSMMEHLLRKKTISFGYCLDYTPTDIQRQIPKNLSSTLHVCVSTQYSVVTLKAHGVGLEEQSSSYSSEICKSDFLKPKFSNMLFFAKKSNLGNPMGIIFC